MQSRGGHSEHTGKGKTGVRGAASAPSEVVEVVEVPAGYANNHLMNSPGRTSDQVVEAVVRSPLAHVYQLRTPRPLRDGFPSVSCAHALQLNQQHAQRVGDELSQQPQLALLVEGAMCLVPNRESGAPAQTS